VNEEKRDGSLHLALLVYEVHVDRPMSVDVDLNFVVGERVEFRFMRSPVEFGTPVVNNTLDVLSGVIVSVVLKQFRMCCRDVLQDLHWSAVVPTRPIFELGWKFRIVQSPLQPVQLLLRNVNLVFFDSRHFDVFVREA